MEIHIHHHIDFSPIHIHHHNIDFSPPDRSVLAAIAGVRTIVNGILGAVNQLGVKMVTQADFETAVKNIEDTVSNVVGSVVTAVKFELGELSVALKNAIDAGSMASLQPILDRMNAIPGKITTLTADLMAEATAVDPTPDTGVGGDPIPPTPAPVPTPAPEPTPTPADIPPPPADGTPAP